MAKQDATNQVCQNLHVLHTSLAICVRYHWFIIALGEVCRTDIIQQTWKVGMMAYFP